MKIQTEGRYLWFRTIGSTIVGEGVDSAVFYPVAFFGVWSNDLLVQVLVSNYMIKVVWEAMVTPFTYKIIGFLQKAEHEDYYDHDTNFTPFSIRV